MEARSGQRAKQEAMTMYNPENLQRHIK